MSAQNFKSVGQVEWRQKIHNKIWTERVNNSAKSIVPFFNVLYGGHRATHGKCRFQFSFTADVSCDGSNDTPLVSQAGPDLHRLTHLPGPPSLVRVSPELPRRRDRHVGRHVRRRRRPADSNVHAQPLPEPRPQRTRAHAEGQGRPKLPDSFPSRSRRPVRANSQ